jgi:hypothetical protein
MTGSQVDLIVDGASSVLDGRIVSLSGEEFLARLHGAHMTPMDIHVRLHIDTQSDDVSGRLEAQPVGSTP